ANSNSRYDFSVFFDFIFNLFFFHFSSETLNSSKSSDDQVVEEDDDIFEDTIQEVCDSSVEDEVDGSLSKLVSTRTLVLNRLLAPVHLARTSLRQTTTWVTRTWNSNLSSHISLVRI